MTVTIEQALVRKLTLGIALTLNDWRGHPTTAL